MKFGSVFREIEGEKAREKAMKGNFPFPGSEKGKINWFKMESHSQRTLNCGDWQESVTRTFPVLLGVFWRFPPEQLSRSILYSRRCHFGIAVKGISTFFIAIFSLSGTPS